MENSPAISVIVPVYNVEKHLKKCIDSILSQSFTNFELILVDDGSVDQSGIVCEKYGVLDKRIKVIHQRNSGVSAARNAGIKISEGEYILFIDGDDYIDSDYIEILYKNRTDFTVCGLRKCNIQGNTLSLVSYKPYFTDKNIDYELLFSCGEIYSPYCKMFNAKIVKSNRVFFPVGIQWGEDGLFVVDYLEHVKSINYLEYIGYNYIRYSSEKTLSTTIRLDIMEQIQYSREYCIRKLRVLSPIHYPKIRDIIIDNIIRNCSEFVKRALSIKINFIDKSHIIKHFLKNEYVKMSINEKPFYYSKYELKALRHRSPKYIIISYMYYRRIELIKNKLKKLIVLSKTSTNNQK